MRLIDADAAKKKIIEETVVHLPELDAAAFAVVTAVAEMFDCENDFPTVDAKPVKYGKWIKRFGNKYLFCIYDCSECKCPNPIKTEYCPNCGAEMKE